MTLPSNHPYGRNNLVKIFGSTFKFVQEYIIPNKDILFKLQAQVCVARRELEKAEGKAKVQNDKVNHAYAIIGQFKK